MHAFSENLLVTKKLSEEYDLKTLNSMSFKNYICPCPQQYINLLFMSLLTILSLF